MFLAPISIVIEMGSRPGEGFAALYHRPCSPPQPVIAPGFAIV